MVVLDEGTVRAEVSLRSGDITHPSPLRDLWWRRGRGSFRRRVEPLVEVVKVAKVLRSHRLRKAVPKVVKSVVVKTVPAAWGTKVVVSEPTIVTEATVIEVIAEADWWRSERRWGMCRRRERW